MDKKLKPSTFDNFWDERLKDYPKTDEFKEIYREMLKELSLPERKLKTPVVISMIGIPGTGKSAFSKLLQEIIPAIHLRSDIIGLFKLPQGPDFDYYKAYVIKHALAHHYLPEGFSVIMDDNNRTEYNRERVYKMAKRYKAKNILFFMHLPLGDALNRAYKRDIEEGRVAKFHQTKETLLRFQTEIENPTAEEIKKWKIFYLDIDASKSIEELRSDLKNNPTFMSFLV